MQLVIVDRDTILEPGGGDATSAELAWQTIPDSLEALSRLTGAGYRLVIACNQPDLRRKNFSVENLNALHHRLQHELLEAGGGLDAVFFCSCAAHEECDCLMPNPGMLLDIGSRLRISLEDVPVIGANPASVQAARAAGARPILVSPDDKAAGRSGHKDHVEHHSSLDAAVDSLLAESTHT